VTIVLNRLFGLALLLAHRFQALRRAHTAIGRAIFNELLHVFVVHMQPFGLSIRAVGAPDVRPFIPRQANPPEGA
jgi:hypothetical protein